jgi:heme/copper-type cytochrome/quinol oxidase subunit 4
MTSVLFNAFYDAGNKAGHMFGWIFSIILALATFYVMFKYVFGSSKESK